MYWFESDPLRYGSVIKLRTGNHKSYDWVINKWEGYVKIPSFLNRPEVEKLLNISSYWSRPLYPQYKDPITHKPTSDLWVRFNCSEVFEYADFELWGAVSHFKNAEHFEEAQLECFRVINELIALERSLRRP